MTKPAIKVEGLWKEYVIGSAEQMHSTFYDLLSHTLKAPFKRLRNLGGARDEADQFWALRDINFEVHPGEVLGIIGRNGAGKSTLLKILSRITAPTRGRVTVQGRMASLLEVGTGFHPELSGRENIYLNGSLLGMTRADINRKFDAIVEFAEIEKFIDTPVKRYSSGMYVRLAFSVAAHLDPDILVVDEVLAVGDFEFQKKCLGKMKDVSGDGRTVIFVSHNMPAVQLLCTKALLLDSGALLSFGDCDQIIDQYIGHIERGLGVIESGAGALKLISAIGSYEACADGGIDISIAMVLQATQPLADITVDFGLENKQGVRLLQIMPLLRGEIGTQLSQGSSYEYRLKTHISLIAPGEYFGTLYVHSRAGGAVLHQSNIYLFSVTPAKNAPESMSAGFTAMLVPDYQAKLTLQESSVMLNKDVVDFAPSKSEGR